MSESCFFSGQFLPSVSKLKGSIGMNGFLFFLQVSNHQVVLYLDNKEHLEHVENGGANLL